LTSPSAIRDPDLGSKGALNPLHPTKARLIQAVQQLMEQQALEHITADMVLEASGVSKGSLYHHFEDYSQLVEEVLVARFVAGMDLTIAAVGKVARESHSKQEALVALHLLIAEMNAASRAAVRLERARLLGATQANPRLKKRLGQEQSRLTNGLTDLVIYFQGKGWARQDLDARAIAVLVQAYTLGKGVDDIVDEPMSETSWNHLINQVVGLVFAVSPGD